MSQATDLRTTIDAPRVSVRLDRTHRMIAAILAEGPKTKGDLRRSLARHAGETGLSAQAAWVVVSRMLADKELRIDDQGRIQLSGNRR